MKVRIDQMITVGSILKDVSNPDKYILVTVSKKQYRLVSLTSYVEVEEGLPMSDVSELNSTCAKKGYILVGHADDFDLVKGKR